MFRVTYDAVDMRPVQTEQKYDKTYLDNNVSGNLSIDFNNGRIQTFNTVGISLNIYGIPFGMDMTITLRKWVFVRTGQQKLSQRRALA